MNATFLLGLLCTLATIGMVFLLAALALNSRRKMPAPLQPGWDEIPEPPCHLECWPDEMCEARQPQRNYVCTRPIGHTGQHIACLGGKHAIQVWDDITPKGRWDLPATGEPKSKAN